MSHVGLREMHHLLFVFGDGIFPLHLLLVQILGQQVHMYASSAAALACNWTHQSKIRFIHGFPSFLSPVELSHGYLMIRQPDSQLMRMDWLLWLRNNFTFDFDW